MEVVNGKTPFMFYFKNIGRIKSKLFYTYWDFRIKFCCVKKRFGFYFDQSERRNEFLTRAKIGFVQSQTTV